MKKVSMLLIGLLCISMSILAGELITNDTGEDATGLRVVFSTPVLITAFGDILTNVDQEGLSYEFVFSGRTVPPWGSHWFSYAPATACIMEYEWLTDSIAALQGFSSEQLADRPAVTGDLLNSDYFSHPAYIMQGVRDRDAIFAMPLDGVEELEFYPIVDGVDLENIAWSVEISHPEGIGANIEGRTLYIWGDNTSWVGYGEVTLEAVLNNAVSSVTIPVTVFDSSKTLINSEGKKDYFVSWSPELDINRIRSVDDFLVVHKYEDEALDRTICWSSWKRAELMRSVTLTGDWINEQLVPSWSWEAKKLHIDLMLDELRYDNVDWIFTKPYYFMEEATSNTIIELFDIEEVNRGTPFLSTPEDELSYLVNQAHNKGIRVAFGPFIRDIQFARGEIRPKDWDLWFANYAEIASRKAQLAADLGADLFVVGESLQNVTGTINSRDWSDNFSRILSTCRVLYSGPITYIDGLLIQNGCQDPANWQKMAFLPELDYVSTSPYFVGMIKSEEPTVQDIVEVYPSLIEEFIEPLLEFADRPVILFENGVPSMNGILYNFWEFVAGRYEAEPDGDEQAVWYEGLFRALEGKPWLHGFGWFGINVFLNLGGPECQALTFRRKPAEEIVRGYYGNGDTKRHAILIDGRFADWGVNACVHADPRGDDRSGSDLLGVHVTSDEMYAYVMIEFAQPVRQTDVLTIPVDIDGDRRGDLPVGVFFADKWIATIGNFGMNYRSLRGFLDVELSADKTRLELSIPLRFVEYPASLGIEVNYFDASAQRSLDQSEYVPIL